MCLIASDKKILKFIIQYKYVSQSWLIGCPGSECTVLKPLYMVGDRSLGRQVGLCHIRFTSDSSRDHTFRLVHSDLLSMACLAPLEGGVLGAG